MNDVKARAPRARDLEATDLRALVRCLSVLSSIVLLAHPHRLLAQEVAAPAVVPSAPSTMSPSTAGVAAGAQRATDREPARTDVVAAFRDSMKLLAFEHIIRIATQDKTRRELDGPFWRDYRQSVRIPRHWEDSDAWWVNYIGHPIHGAAAGYSWIDHGPEAVREIDLSSAYWAGRARALAWSAGYSLQFEFGPLSEASIGNVGQRPETTGWVDHVVTPVGAFGLIVAEDALDRFLVKWVETRTRNRFFRATMRLAFNPARTLSNTASGRVPWHRAGRPIGWSR